MLAFGLPLIVAAAVQVFVAPPPPPAFYHPQEGPYVVFVDADGTLDTSSAPRIIEGWSHRRDERLGAFLLCFRSKSVLPQKERAALAGTASALSEAGATAVLIGTSDVCKALPVVSLPDRLVGRDHIEVRGLFYP